MSEAAQELEKKIADRRVRVGVIGLGYVGLPLALAFAEEGLQVLGFDTDASKVARIGRGESYIGYLDEERVGNLVKEGRFEATTEMARLSEPDVVLICVPTPLDSDGEPDLGYVQASGRLLANALRVGQLVILESTTYPGTTDEVLRPILETSELAPGQDFFLAYSPEREDPGNKTFSLHSTPKVIGADDPLSKDLAVALYQRIVARVVPVSSTRVAEASKLTENIYRAVNIALVNELKMVYDAMGIDIWEVLDAAATKPFGFQRFNPGPGWGGHCIPVDPFYLAWKAKQHGARARFVELAGSVNIEMPLWVVDKLETALQKVGKRLRGAQILVIGVAYKKNVSDPRESPTFQLITELLKRDAIAAYHDPHIPTLPRMRSWPELPAMHSRELNEETLSLVDAVVIATDHEDVDYDLIARAAKLVVDSRGVLDKSSPRVVRA